MDKKMTSPGCPILGKQSALSHSQKPMGQIGSFGYDLVIEHVSLVWTFNFYFLCKVIYVHTSKCPRIP